MKKLIGYRSNDGKIYEDEVLAILGDLEELKRNIENTWLKNIKHKNPMRFLIDISDHIEQFSSDIENYKKKHREYANFFACENKFTDPAEI